jgi:hypothetical protein
MAYATGKYSYGLCDYCGQRYPYNVLKKKLGAASRSAQRITNPKNRSLIR